MLTVCFLTTSSNLDLICIPGGFGVCEVMGDAETVDFVRQHVRSARYVTSV